MGHKDMASAGAYNGSPGAEPLVRGSGGRSPPEAESFFVFGRLIMQYFAVFIRFSADNCVTLFEIEITR